MKRLLVMASVTCITINSFGYYNPEQGRWASRDPIGESGGLNLFGMVGNDPLNAIDILGLDDIREENGGFVYMPETFIGIDWTPMVVVLGEKAIFKGQTMMVFEPHVAAALGIAFAPADEVLDAAAGFWNNVPGTYEGLIEKLKPYAEQVKQNALESTPRPGSRACILNELEPHFGQVYGMGGTAGEELKKALFGIVDFAEGVNPVTATFALLRGESASGAKLQWQDYSIAMLPIAVGGAKAAKKLGGLIDEAGCVCKTSDQVAAANMTGYRAVSKAELDDIAENGFRPHPEGRSMQDKWFSESREGAEAFQKTYPELEHVVEAKVPKSVYDASHKHPNIDQTGPGFAVPAELQPQLKPKLP